MYVNCAELGKTEKTAPQNCDKKQAAQGKRRCRNPPPEEKGMPRPPGETKTAGCTCEKQGGFWFIVAIFRKTMEVAAKAWHNKNSDIVERCALAAPCFLGSSGEVNAAANRPFPDKTHKESGKMNRYQFELLAYLEKTGAQVYSLRTLVDTLNISGSAIGKCLEELEAERLVERSGGTVAITAAGLEAMEPYRVRKAVIMAAGFGSRMMPATADRPKPMVTVNGVRIIETLLDALVAVGITDITLVRGYKKERFDELLVKYPFLQLVDNDIYNVTNNISSVMAVLDKIDNCYLCEADLYITNPAVITKYQYASNILGSYSLETDDWSFQLDENGHIIHYQKGNTYCYNYYGISYWTAEDSAKLRADFKQVYEEEENGNDYFWEFIPLVLRREKYAVEIRQCRKSDIMEIDNYHELADLDSSYKI